MNFSDDLEDIEFPEQPEDADAWKTTALREAAKPLMELALQILKTTQAIVETIPETDEDDNFFAHYREGLMENALKLRPKIAGAMGTGDYILMSEYAVVIKLAARELMAQTSGLKMMGYENHDYLNALRSEIEDFRELFVKWVRSFPREEPLWPDGWALFYTEEDVAKWNEMNPDEEVKE
jgi:hypothetical protein